MLVSTESTMSSSLTRSSVRALSSKGKVWHSKWNCRRIGCTPAAVRPLGAPRVGRVGSHTSQAAGPRRQGLRGPGQRLRTTGPGGPRSIPVDGGARRGYKVERGSPVEEGDCKARGFLTRQRRHHQIQSYHQSDGAYMHHCVKALERDRADFGPLTLFGRICSDSRTH